MRPLLPLSGSSGFPGCVRILNKKGKARSKLIFQHREEMLFPASYKTGANKTDTGAHCPANNVVMGDGRLRKQSSGRRERLIFPHKCECECACMWHRLAGWQRGRPSSCAGRAANPGERPPSDTSNGEKKKGGRRKGWTSKERNCEEKGEDRSPRSHPMVHFKSPMARVMLRMESLPRPCAPRARPAPLEPERASLQEVPVRGALAGPVGTNPARGTQAEGQPLR